MNSPPALVPNVCVCVCMRERERETETETETEGERPTDIKDMGKGAITKESGTEREC